MRVYFIVRKQTRRPRRSPELRPEYNVALVGDDRDRQLVTDQRLTVGDKLVIDGMACAVIGQLWHAKEPELLLCRRLPRPGAEPAPGYSSSK